MPLRAPPSLLVAPVLVAWATTGCVATVRGTVGAEAANDGAQPVAAAQLGFGFGGNLNQGLLVVGGQAGLRGATVMAGGEYNRNLRTPEKPLGLRVRLDVGVEALYAPPSNGKAAAVVGAAVPGVWWMPLHTAYRPHRFVLAIEPRIGARTPLGTETKVSPYGGLGLIFEYDWVPCTMFGAGSCDDGPNPRP